MSSQQNKVFKNALYFEKFSMFRETLLRGFGVTEYNTVAEWAINFLNTLTCLAKQS